MTRIRLVLLTSSVLTLTALVLGQGPETAELSQEQLIAKGRDLFLNETFDGNGRTCGTCHPAENNFTLDAAFIATLADDDPLFVAETDPELATLERPELLRKFGLILENLDGFGDLDNKFVMRSVNHTFALRTSIVSPRGPHLGWSGDGSPGDGSLRSFATGAVIQHLPRTLNRVVDVDFRLPSEDELDALEAFQFSLGRQSELELPLSLAGVVPSRGQEIFLDDSLGKCNICHVNAGANASIGGQDLGNANFDTGVEDLPDQPGRLTGEIFPRDDGFGSPGNGEFNTPPLVEAADTPPFFHNNAVDTIEGAVAFYSGDAFNDSPSGQILASTDPEGVGIRLDATQTVAVAAFLRVLNALENIRSSSAQIEQTLDVGPSRASIELAAEEIDDAIDVLAGAGLHPFAVGDLESARHASTRAAASWFFKRRYLRTALNELDRARGRLLEGGAS